MASDWDNHALGLSGELEITKYHDNVEENSLDLNIGANGRLDVLEKSNLNGSLNFARKHQDRGDPDDDVAGVVEAELTIFRPASLTLGGEYNADAILLRLNTKVDRTDFDDAGATNNDDRDRVEFETRGRVGYEWVPGSTAFVEAALDIREFDKAVDDGGFKRSSHGYEILLGNTLDLTGVTFAELGLGYIRQDFGDQPEGTQNLGPTKGFSFKSSVVWNPTDLLSVTSKMRRTVNETTVLGRRLGLYLVVRAQGRLWNTREPDPRRRRGPRHRKFRRHRPRGQEPGDETRRRVPDRRELHRGGEIFVPGALLRRTRRQFRYQYVHDILGRSAVTGTLLCWTPAWGPTSGRTAKRVLHVIEYLSPRMWPPAVLLLCALLASSPSHGQLQQEYRIGPGDRLNVTVFGHPDLSSELLVDGSGRISMPLIGQIPANGKTLSELQADITVAFDRDFIINPRVTVEVVNFRPFYILGQVARPGSYPYIEGMTVRMAVAIAGGFTRRAREDPIIVIRANDPEQEKIEVGQDALVLPGDLFEVDRRLF